jgi:uncharacterized protein
MGRLLLLIALAVLALFLWRKLTARASPQSTARPPRIAEKVVACAHCGLHVPASEALTEGEHAYCCLEHLRRGKR